MTSEIRMRGAHPPRTPSSGNHNALTDYSSDRSATRRGSRQSGDWSNWSANYHDGGASTAVLSDGQTATSSVDSYTSPVRAASSGGYAPLHIQYQQDDSGTAGATPPYDNMGKIRTGKLLRAEKTRLEDYHVAYRTPLHVPDNEYRTYLLGRSGRGRCDKPIITRVCCLHTCIGFSVVAILFLCMVGFLINSQPILMAGTLTPKEVQDSDGRLAILYVLPAPGEVPPMARTAYRAAMAYFVCILACLVALNPGWIPSQIKRKKEKYEDIPDQPLPMIHNPPDTPSWTQTVWHRCSYIIRQWLTDRGWYRPGPKIKKDRKTGSKYK